MFMKQMLLLISFFLFVHIYADSEREQATRVANRGYKEFLSKCLTPAGREVHGLTDFENASNATLGEAIEILDLTAENIINFKQGEGVSSLLKTKHSYYFPVIFNGRIKLLLRVYKWEGSDYEIGSLGDAFIAGEFAKIKKQYPYSREHKMIYAECYQANACVFSFPELDNQNVSFINITPGQRTDYSKPSNVDDAVKIMLGNIHESIKAEIQKGVKK